MKMLQDIGMQSEIAADIIAPNYLKKKLANNFFFRLQQVYNL